MFTTIQKFMPDERGEISVQNTQPSVLLLLSDRNDIVVGADEAHRSLYDFIDSFVRHRQITK